MFCYSYVPWDLALHPTLLAALSRLSALGQEKSVSLQKWKDVYRCLKNNVSGLVLSNPWLPWSHLRNWFHARKVRGFFFKKDVLVSTWPFIQQILFSGLTLNIWKTSNKFQCNWLTRKLLSDNTWEKSFTTIPHNLCISHAFKSWQLQ